LVEIEALQPVVEYFGRKALEKLWYQMLFILTSVNRVLWKSNVIYALITNRLVCSMLPGLTFIYFNQLIVDVEIGTVMDKCYEYDIITVNCKLTVSETKEVKNTSLEQK